MVYPRHGQSAALQLIFAALGPFLLLYKQFKSIKTNFDKKCTYFFSISIKKIKKKFGFAEIICKFEKCGPNRKIIFKFYLFIYLFIYFIYFIYNFIIQIWPARKKVWPPLVYPNKCYISSRI